MKLPLFLFFGLCVMLTSISGYNFAYAFFMSSAANNSNSFTAAEVFPSSATTPSAAIDATPTEEVLPTSETIPTPTATLTPTPTQTITPSPTVTLTQTPTPTSSNIANHIVINEILFDPSTGQSIAGGDDSASEWVELYNPTNSTIDLTGWKIEDNGGASGAESLTGTIPPHGFAIVSVAAENDFRVRWTSVPAGVIFNLSSGSIGSNGLSNTGDSLVLKNSLNGIIDSMSYDNDSSQLNPPALNGLEGHSLERDPDGKDTDTASDFIDRTSPQPGI